MPAFGMDGGDSLCIAESTLLIERVFDACGVATLQSAAGVLEDAAHGHGDALRGQCRRPAVSFIERFEAQSATGKDEASH